MPPESLESHDTDEMDMSDDDESTPNLRYGKRPRNDTKVITAVRIEIDRSLSNRAI